MDENIVKGYAIISSVCLLLQLILAPNIAINGIVPNILFIVVSLTGFLGDSKLGCIAGFVCGFILDLIGSGPLGAMALICSCMGFVCGLLPKSIFSENWISPIAYFTLCSIAANLLYGIILIVFGSRMGLIGMIFYFALPTALYDLAFAFIVFPIVYWLLSQNKPKISAGHSASRKNFVSKRKFR